MKHHTDFWSNVNKSTPDACWKWQGLLDRQYPRYRLDGKNYSATRFSYYLATGEFPPSRIRIYQTCNNQLCVNPNHLKLSTIENRFWMNVERLTLKECWEWKGTKGNAGYGVIGVGQTTTGAHRLSYELHNGPIPEDSWVLHRCDNPSCVNPNHLFLGSISDNVQDAIEKGRWNYSPPYQGEKAPNSKLTTEDVRAIRTLYAEGNHTHRNLAHRFGVSHQTIGNIINRKKWVHV